MSTIKRLRHRRVLTRERSTARGTTRGTSGADRALCPSERAPCLVASHARRTCRVACPIDFGLLGVANDTFCCNARHFLGCVDKRNWCLPMAGNVSCPLVNRKQTRARIRHRTRSVSYWRDSATETRQARLAEREHADCLCNAGGWLTARRVVAFRQLRSQEASVLWKWRMPRRRIAGFDDAAL